MNRQTKESINKLGGHKGDICRLVMANLDKLRVCDSIDSNKVDCAQCPFSTEGVWNVKHKTDKE